MKEIKTILNLIDAKKTSNEKYAIAQVVNVEGSSYRREGARMIVFESGIFEGGISGGCLEGDTLKRSQLAILKQEPSLITYDTSKEQEIGIGLGCNGIIDVLMTPLHDESSSLKILKKCTADRKSHVVLTITSLSGSYESLKLGDSFYYDTTSKKLEGHFSAEFEGFLLENIDKVISRNKSDKYQFTGTNTTVGVYIELIPAQIHLAIYGDNYDVYPMIDLAKVLDWDISLVGNMQKLRKEKISDVTHLYHKDFEERPQIDERTAVILMAHDFKSDSKNLIQALKSKSPYIASLGPKKRFDKMIKGFETRGQEISAKDLIRIHAPSGLEIGADTPEEIAMSIFSEILAVFNRKNGGMLKMKNGPIHDRN